MNDFEKKKAKAEKVNNFPTTKKIALIMAP